MTAAAGAAVLSKPLFAATPSKPGVLNLSAQETLIPGASLKEKAANLEKWGAAGLEICGDPRGRVADAKEAIKGTSLRISAVCWGSCNGDLVSPDKAVRKAGIDKLKEVLIAAGELESTGVIFVPCFNKQSELKPEELDKILWDILPEIGDHAHNAGSRILIEPLNKGETFYINRIEQAAAICRKVNNPGICLMGDFYHMAKEEKSDSSGFKAGAQWVHHVHLASRVRWLPGQDKLKEPDKQERSFVDGFQALYQIGYQDFCSLECDVKKGKDPLLAIPEAFDFLRGQWQEAVQMKH